MGFRSWSRNILPRRSSIGRWTGRIGRDARNQSAHKVCRQRGKSGLGAVMQMQYNEAKEILMPANALVQTRIDPAVKERAAAVLEGIGITVSEAVRILLTRTANEGALPFALTN